MKLSKQALKGVKKVQWLSFNDENFKTLFGANLRFNEIINCGIWTNEDFENMVDEDEQNLRKTFRLFEECKIKSKRQLINHTRTPNDIMIKRNRKNYI